MYQERYNELFTWIISDTRTCNKILNEFQANGGIENVWCIRLCCNTNLKSSGVMKGVSK